MIAIVDAAAKLGVEIGTAAAAGVIARLIKAHLPSRSGERHGRGKPGEPSADDMRQAAGRYLVHASP